MLSPYGQFSPDGSEYIINTPDLPRNWYNYFFNDHYITFTSQAGIGQGFLQDNMGRRIMPVCGRGVYIHDGEIGWNLAGLPVHEKNDRYSCTHGIGYTVITLEKNGIKTEYGIFVPCDGRPTAGYEVLWVKIINLTDRKKSVKVMAYADNYLDGGYSYQGYNTSSVYYDGKIRGIRYPVSSEWHGKPTDFEVFVACGQDISGYDCAKNAFIGPYGSIFDPKAIHSGGCGNSDCVAEKFGFAVEHTVELAPKEIGFVSFVMGVAESTDSINEICDSVKDEQQISALLGKIRDKNKTLFEGVSIETPDHELNCLFNNWLKYQTNLGSRFARVRHNGYRDIASDTECLSAFAPELAWERIKRLLSYQYSNGYAPRTFIDGTVCDHNFSDCTVWLTFAVYEIIMELGKPELLNETVPFNDGSEASVYEHLRRSVDFLYNFRGNYGLIKIWCGDWNDCMNKVGEKQKGVSIWLTMAWYRANRMFAELAQLLGKTDDVSLAEERGEEMRQLIDKYGWDEKGSYYRYAYTDDFIPVGASECDEGKIYLNTQLWAVLSGVAYDGKERQAMANAEKLLSGELGTVVFAPPYSKYIPHIGAITAKAAGVQENGGVYLHTMCWKLAVDAMLGRPDLVEYDITRILPFRNPVVNGRGEPYSLFNCYMGNQTGYRYGTPGQSWRTATGQWFLNAMCRYVFGLRATVKGLEIRPCLPQSWDKARVTKRFRGCVYVINYNRTKNSEIIADGKRIDGELLPYREGETIEVTVNL